MKTIYLIISQRQFIIFLCLTIALVITEYFVTLSTSFRTNTNSIAFGVTFDLLIGIPLIYYFLIIKSLKAPFFTIAFALLLSFSITYLLLPFSHHQYWTIAEKGIILTELGVMAYAIYNIKRIVNIYKNLSKHSTDFVDNIHQAVRTIFGNNLMSTVIASEVIMLRYGLFFGWNNKPEIDTFTINYTIHKESGFTTLMGALIGVSIVEMIVAHLLLVRWNETIALVAILLSIYTIIFLIGHLFSTVRRRVSISTNSIIVRAGLLWNFRVNLLDIQEVVRAKEATKDKFNIAKFLLTEPNVLLKLKSPIQIIGIYGIKKTTQEIYLAIDNADNFIANIKTH